MSDASCPTPDEHPDGRSDAPRWRQDELVARILRRWRELTGGKHTRDADRKTLVACSGGIDSMTLGFSLAQVQGACVVAHIRHDIRPDSETQADAEFVKQTAQAWGAAYVESSIQVNELDGNLEANARAHRYGALAQLAKENGCPYIATGHHADDQLETLMLSLMRGSGVNAMGGMKPTRQMDGCTLIRPMLGIQRSELESLLQRAEIPWREDPTNTDTNYARNRVRHELLPMLRNFDQEIAVSASNWASDLQGLQELARSQVGALFERGTRTESGEISWLRAELIDCPDVVLGLLPLWMCEHENDRQGQDSITRRAIDAWVRSLKSQSTDPTEHRIGPIVSRVDAHSVTMIVYAGDL